MLLAEAADLMLKKKVNPGDRFGKDTHEDAQREFQREETQFLTLERVCGGSGEGGLCHHRGKKGPEALVYPVPAVFKKEGTLKQGFKVLLEVLSELDRGNSPAYHSLSER